METGLSIGSNLGDRLTNLGEAKRRILAMPGVFHEASSAVYETEPMDVKDEYRDMKFLNTVLIVSGDYRPADWLRMADEVEEAMGRVRTDDRNAPRVIDIDILYAGDFIIHEPGFVLPHPRWADREFVVQPLADVRPDLVLPGTGCRVTDVLEAVQGTNGVVRVAEAW